jgi:hypothetical protein
MDCSLKKDLTRVDIIIGGGHGDGKFCMTMKVNFHFPDKTTVFNPNCKCNFSKDKTKILRATVFDSIGKGLQLIDSGDSFIVLDIEFTLEFSLCNTANQSVHCSCPLQVYLVDDLKFFEQMFGRKDMSIYWCMW